MERMTGERSALGKEGRKGWVGLRAMRGSRQRYLSLKIQFLALSPFDMETLELPYTVNQLSHRNTLLVINDVFAKFIENRHQESHLF